MIQSALKIDLPYTKPLSTLTKEVKNKIMINKKGEIYLNDALVENFIVLENEFAKIKDKNAGLQVQADKDVNYGLVVKVLSYAQKLGITKFELVTQNMAE